MKKFSIYKLISVLAFIALIFILALPNFFNINKKQEAEQCIKNMKAVYKGAEDFLNTENKDFSGTTSDLERMGYLNKAYECPSEAPGDKYLIKIDAETKQISVRCINEINSSPDLSTGAFEDLIYFVNIIKFHQKPTSQFIYDKLNDPVRSLLDEHIAFSNSLFDIRTILDWDKFIANLNARRNDPIVKSFWDNLNPDAQQIITKWHRIENPLTIDQKQLITDQINTKFIESFEFSEDITKSLSLGNEGNKLHKIGYNDMNQTQKQRFNRIVLELIFPYEFQVSSKYNFPSDELLEALVDNLNELLAANTFNDPAFINEIKLSSATISKLEEQPSSRSQIALTNRLLLQDAYPTLLVKYEDKYGDHRLNDH